MLDTDQKEQLAKIRELRATPQNASQVKALLDALGDPALRLAAGLEGSPSEAQAAMDAAPDAIVDELAQSLRLRSESFRKTKIPGLHETAGFVCLELHVPGWPNTRAFEYLRDAAALRVLARCPDHPTVRELIPKITKLFIDGSTERRTNVTRSITTELDISGLGALTHLEVLVLVSCRDLNGASLEACERLRRVVVHATEDGTLHLDAPNLDSIFLEPHRAPTIEGLAHATKLREIVVTRSDVKGIMAAFPHLHALETIDISGTWRATTTDLAPMAAMKRLRVLRLSEIEASAEPLRGHPSLEEALLPGLQDAAPLAGMPRLRSLDLVRGRFRTLESWRGVGMPVLEHLDVAQTSLETLDGVDACPKLKKLIAGRTDVLVNADALKDHPSLEEIVLEDAFALKSLKSIGKLPRLKRLALKGSKVTASRISDDVLPFVDPQTLVQKRRATLLAKKQGMKKPKRGELSKLKKLLLTRDWDQIDLGLQLADSLDDPKIFDALTTGAKWAGAGFPSKQILVQNTVFKGPKVAPWRLYALLNLIAVAPAGTEAAKLRDELTSLMITGDYAQSARVRLTHLHAFSHLRLLYLSSCDVVDAAALEKMPALEELDSHQIDLDGPIRLPPSARKVVLGCSTKYRSSRPKVDVFGDMKTFGHVETLWVSHAKLTDPTAIANLASVKSISFSGVDLPPGGEDALRALPSNPQVHVRD